MFDDGDHPRDRRPRRQDRPPWYRGPGRPPDEPPPFQDQRPKPADPTNTVIVWCAVILVLVGLFVLFSGAIHGSLPHGR